MDRLLVVSDLLSSPVFFYLDAHWGDDPPLRRQILKSYRRKSSDSVQLGAIAEHYGVTFRQLIDGGLHEMCLLGQDATLCAATGKTGKVAVTDLYRQLFEEAGDIKPKNISIDTLSRAFAGNEIDRVQVYAFAMHMQALAMVANGSVTVLSHPSLSGIASGSGISGSTAWHGAFRFRQYLTGIKPDAGEQPDSDLRQLEFKKNQYGPTAETVVLRYQRGLFLPKAGMGTLDKLAAEQKADEIFQTNVARFTGQNRNVSHKLGAHAYAPAEFAKEKEAKDAGIRKADLEAAMRRLLTTGKIKVESYGSRECGSAAIRWLAAPSSMECRFMCTISPLRLGSFQGTVILQCGSINEPCSVCRCCARGRPWAACPNSPAWPLAPRDTGRANR
jgi:hypothetical protein